MEKTIKAFDFDTVIETIIKNGNASVVMVEMPRTVLVGDKTKIIIDFQFTGGLNKGSLYSMWFESESRLIKFLTRLYKDEAVGKTINQICKDAIANETEFMAVVKTVIAKSGKEYQNVYIGGILPSKGYKVE